jgi:hypothetical protein
MGKGVNFFGQLSPPIRIFFQIDTLPLTLSGPGRVGFLSAKVRCDEAGFSSKLEGE